MRAHVPCRRWQIGSIVKNATRKATANSELLQADAFNQALHKQRTQGNKEYLRNKAAEAGTTKVTHGTLTYAS